MMLKRRRAGALLAVVLLTACGLGGSGSGSGTAARPSTSNTITATASAAPLTGSLTSGAEYKIDVPAGWNGTLVLYSHGYVASGRANPATDGPGGDVAAWMAQHGYATAGTSYSQTGWALEQAFNDQIAVLDLFAARVGKPTRTIAWGHSLGGIITAGLVQLHPERFAAALPMCGVLAGGVAAWNSGLDGAFAFKTLIGPGSSLQVVHIADPGANNQLAAKLITAAQDTPTGRARLALIAALGDEPGWFDPTQPEPPAGDFAAQELGQYQWMLRVSLVPYGFGARAEVEKRAGGNPSWNTGVDYGRALEASSYKPEVTALYQQAGLSLDADLAALASALRIPADAGAPDYLVKNIVFDGNLKVPVLTLHTTDDGLVLVQNEQAYAATAQAAGRQGMLRQLYVHRAGHCVFTNAEELAAFQALVGRIETGKWDEGALSAGAMNQAATALGSRYNGIPPFASNVPAAFAGITPSAFPRPFDSRSKLP